MPLNRSRKEPHDLLAQTVRCYEIMTKDKQMRRLSFIFTQNKKKHRLLECFFLQDIDATGFVNFLHLYNITDGLCISM